MSDDDIVYFFVALNRMLLARSYNKRLIFPISFRASMRGNFKIPIEKCNAIYTIMKIFLSLSFAFCAIESFFFFLLDALHPFHVLTAEHRFISYVLAL